MLVVYIISRHGQSQGLLYKHLCDSLIMSVIHPFPLTALRRRHTQTVKDSSLSYKIDYVKVMKSFLNPKGHQNGISGSKITVILPEGLILPIGGVALKGFAPAACAAGLFGTSYSKQKNTSS